MYGMADHLWGMCAVSMGDSCKDCFNILDNILDFQLFKKHSNVVKNPSKV